MTTAKNTLQQLQELGQSVWLDNVSRGIINSGELQRLIDLGVSGLTSNPTIFEKAISSSGDYDAALIKLARDGKSTEDIYNTLVVEDIRSAADVLRPVYDRTGGADGFASLEPSPHLAHDTQGTIDEVRKKFAELDRPNVMVKVPATPEGIPAVQQLLSEGININITLIFSLEAYSQVREAYLNGLEKYAASGGDISKVRSVASFFVSRVDTAVDGQLNALVGNGRSELSDLQGKAAVANAKLAYAAFKETFGSERFAALKSQGARVQRPLWASTSVKNPAYSDVLYVEPLIGRDTVNTMPEVTMDAVLDHGQIADRINDGVDDAMSTIQRLEEAGVSMDGVTFKLLADGVKAFADSYDQLLGNIENKKSQLLAEAR